MVGLSIMGAAAPSMMTMSIAPFEAQKRAQNFGVAESKAVTFAAQNEGADQVANAPDGCTINREDAPAIEISCTEGPDTKYVQSVTRTFLSNESNSGSATSRQFFYPQNPFGFTHNQCRGFEDWGGQTAAFNRDTWEWVAASCEPSPARGLAWYNDSHPDNWRIDINNYNGLPHHEHY